MRQYYEDARRHRRNVASFKCTLYKQKPKDASMQLVSTSYFRRGEYFCEADIGRSIDHKHYESECSAS